MVSGVVLVGCQASRLAAPVVPPATELPPNYTVEYDSLLQTPRYVANRDAIGSARPGEPPPYSHAEAFQFVRRFVLRHAPVFRLRPLLDDFAVTWADGRDGANFVKIQQTYRGVPLDVMGYGTMVLPGGAMGTMIGRFMPGISVDVRPSVAQEAATRTAIAALSPTVVILHTPPKLTIVTDDLRPRLTWWVVVRQESGFFSWTVIVDARDGAVVRVVQNWIDG